MRDIEELNGASIDDAFAAFLQCCGSVKWAKGMADARPFHDTQELLMCADRVWWSLDENDWLEAFSAHPKIGEKRQSKSSESDRWAKEEQSGANRSASATLDALLKANHDYELRFGYIFIVCATGKSGEEMLALLNHRIGNKPATEIQIAAEEQRHITHIRLNKLIGNLE